MIFIKKFLNILVSLILTTLAFAMVYSITVDYEYETYIRINEHNEEVEIDPRTFEDEDELLRQMAYDYFNVKNKNDNLIGWLNVPNIGYYPVMATDNNSFYLNHDEYDKYWGNGSVFMNTESLHSFVDTALLHGHHIRNGKMFGSLVKFKDEKFFQKNDLSLIFDGENFYYYKQYTTFLLKDGEEWIKQHGLNEVEREEYMSSLYRRSMVKMEEGLEPNLKEQMLFLQTCDYTFTDARLIVGFYRVRTIPYNPAIHGPFN